ncbi:hypothetical protein KQX54_002163 [Cotesia glomerata]|uniref:Uncharacterized protein n=1 Tax=Cotesia glomerata TaxID=32391 RepID=A0AAV7I4Q7_COTGL|nr:hypothetical protein KQX54_002163 [Cotesia glomerata]
MLSISRSLVSRSIPSELAGCSVWYQYLALARSLPSLGSFYSRLELSLLFFALYLGFPTPALGKRKTATRDVKYFLMFPQQLETTILSHLSQVSYPRPLLPHCFHPKAAQHLNPFIRWYHSRSRLGATRSNLLQLSASSTITPSVHQSIATQSSNTIQTVTVYHEKQDQKRGFRCSLLPSTNQLNKSWSLAHVRTGETNHKLSYETCNGDGEDMGQTYNIKILKAFQSTAHSPVCWPVALTFIVYVTVNLVGYYPGWRARRKGAGGRREERGSLIGDLSIGALANFRPVMTPAVAEPASESPGTVCGYYADTMDRERKR